MLRNLPINPQFSGSSCSLFSSDLFLLPTQSEEDWNVIYKETEICENKGSTVFIWSSFDYPAKINNVRTTVEKSFWFFETEGEPVDLREDPKYKDRVTYRRYGNDCNLKISEVRESDSGVYKFRLITNHENRNYTGEPGVRLTVEDLQLKCFNKCDPDVLERYFWFINGEETRSMMWSESSQTFTYKNWTSSTDRISCAVRYYGMSHGMFHRSPEVYAPQTASVSLTPPGEILEGSSVTLTCSSDANPAANFTWFKERNSKVLSVDPQFVFSSIQSTDSGEYYCRAENQLGWKRSDFRVEVKYAPQNISVSVNPPEILEGGSVTLTCSSDANPAANFTWFKENKDSLKSEEQIFTISNFTAEGLYICVAQNQLGQQNSTVQVWVGSGKLETFPPWSLAGRQNCPLIDVLDN
uniref:B-cell receptor CD22 n=1 Tax=Oryzias latipes TaxID=8090 RepID=A0A3P9IKP0_ORYLA